MHKTQTRRHHDRQKLFAGRTNRTLPMIVVMLVALVAFVALVSALIGQAQGNP